MPNIIEQRLDSDGLFIRTSNGREYTVTPAMMLIRFVQSPGNAAAKRAAVITWVKDEMIAALGADMVSPDEIFTDFDTSNGRFVKMVVGSGE